MISEEENLRGGYTGSIRNSNFDRARSRSRQRQYSGNFRRNNRSSSRSSQVLQQVPIEIDLDASSAGNTITLPKIV